MGMPALQINFCECIIVTVAALVTGEFVLKNKRRDFFETARRLPFGGHVPLGMMEHPTLEAMAATCLKRCEARGGGILVPTIFTLASVISKKCFSNRSDVLTQRW